MNYCYKEFQLFFELVLSTVVQMYGNEIRKFKYIVVRTGIATLQQCYGQKRIKDFGATGHKAIFALQLETTYIQLL